MKCGCCDPPVDVVYAGIPAPHLNHQVWIQNAAPPFDMHGAVQLGMYQFLVPLSDGAIVLCMDARYTRN
jgi:hypothetical protein